MKNVRIDSLHPDRQTALQDCSHCIKRRIKCDRSIPHCAKCVIRDLQCPGYNPSPLKWGQGIASRGKFMGKTRPILEPDELTRGRVSPKRAARDADHGSVDAAPETPLDPGNAISISLPVDNPSWIERYTSGLVLGHLHHHFFHKVVPRMRWVDLPDNPWRKTIQPMAEGSLCLRVAMASHAAAHLSITCSGSADERAHFHSLYQHLRDSSLRMLNERMRTDLLCENDTLARNILVQFPVDILASTLLLCYAAAFVPDCTDWKLHLRACQTIIGAHNPQCRALSSTSVAFLLKEVADIEIFSGISAFDQKLTPITDSFFQQLHKESPWTFTKLIEEVTTLERTRYEYLRIGQSVPDVQMQLWHQRAEEAYSSVMASVGSFLEQQPERECLDTVILVHHHAVVIYSYQALAPRDELHKALDLFLDPLQNCVHSIIYGPEQRFSHDLFMPLFILGAECRGNKARQVIVEDLFLKLLFVTGLWWNHSALQFLRIYWSNEDLSNMNWLQFARKNESQFGNFILF
ncbi:hypothetical protein BJY04DRAFT_193524 [Aspergillus karnatakaensis]|uniref:Zn(II)2Cys6 transcription factor n=1 Tax=Aspergillus karnatakaensis TaxID=1810916 RepID=UPI003CCC9E52